MTKSDQSQAQQGLLSPLMLPSPFPWLWFRQIVHRDSGILVHPFMRVTNQMTRHLATLRESQLLPPLTRASLNLFTLTFSALGRIHIVSTRLSTPSQCFVFIIQSKSPDFYQFQTFPVSVFCAKKRHKQAQPPQPNHQPQQPHLNTTHTHKFGAIPSCKLTVLICRLPLPTFFYSTKGF